MLNNYFLIREAASMLDRKLRNFRIEEAYTQEKNKLVFVFSKEEEVYSLEYSISKNSEYVILNEGFHRAKKNFAGLFPEIYGFEVQSSFLYKDDRIINLRLDKDIDILISFVTNKYNCFIVRKGVIVNAFKELKDYEKREVDEIFKDRKKHLEKEVSTVKEYIKLNYPEFGKIYAKEVLHYARLSYENKLTSSMGKLIDKYFAELSGKISAPRYLLYKDKDEYIPSLIQLEHKKDDDVEEFESVRELIKAYLRSRFRVDKVHSVKDRKVEELNAKIYKSSARIKGISKQIEEFKKADKYKKYGELILANIPSINEGEEALNTNDPLTGEEYSIKLDPDLKPAENANVYFDKYKKRKNAIGTLERKLEDFKKERIILEKELEDTEKIKDLKKIIKMEKQDKENRKTYETSKFRKFILNDKYEVWVGKNSESNDILTTKYAAPNDLWFHARGVGGSHTVLKVFNKKEPVPKDIVRKAASISAYYSKARNASNVPVAYCEKKYVKKRKGFKSGSVVMTREKVVMVKPELPES